MRISGFQESFIDYPGKVSCVVFTSGCNYRCPSCHAKHIVEGRGEVKEGGVLDYLDLRKGWTDALVLCGGEPTIHSELPEFINLVRRTGLKIKLDTNGSNPEMLEMLLNDNVVDYVAMDIKGPAYLYSSLIGRNMDGLKGRMEKSMSLVSRFPDYEFRTTIVPVERFGCEDLSFISIHEIEEIARWILVVTGDNSHKYFLQGFQARGEEEMVDLRFTKDNLPRNLHETPHELLEVMGERVRKYLPKCEVRGK